MRSIVRAVRVTVILKKKIPTAVETITCKWLARKQILIFLLYETVRSATTHGQCLILYWFFGHYN